MTGKILKSILTVAIAVLLASLLVITGLLYQDFTYVQHTQLKDELRFAAAATEQLGKDYLEKLPSDRYRLTLVTADGTVLFDSRADSQSMENHSDREEIQEALAGGTGSSSRYSSTLTEKTIYEAIRLEDGSILRISVSSATAAALVLDLLYPIAIIAILAIILSVWLARRMAERVVEPLNRLNLDEPMANEAYEELSPMLHRLHAQHQEIDSQLRMLQRKQEEFDQITGNMKEALVLLDPHGRIVSINPTARRLFHLKPSCIGENFPPDQQESNMHMAVRRAWENGRYEFRDTLNGREYLFDISCIASDKAIHGIAILAFDVTEQVNAERNRREFTANVSHELKTPLQSIIGSAELIENGIVKPEDLSRFVGHIRTEATRLVTLIEDIIRLSQLDEGSEMPHETVSLRALSEEVSEILSHAASRKGISLTVSGDSGIINGVRRLLFELVYNLCDNAIRYNIPGGAVHITITDDSEQVCLSIADTGIGIPAEHHSKIFERFYRVDKSHSKQSGGTGLGLSIVKHAVQYHHGSIHISSEVEKGTVISVWLKKQL